ncbi:MAG TPA: ATP-binding protein [Oligoflexia bacterium]|nr:ATP-binding protein [Oligoflexia bacterium]
MYSAVLTCTLVGFEAHAVVCEVHLANQLPSVTLVGLPSSITQESRDRVRSAIVNSGLEWPARKVTINLSPAMLPKWGSHFELAMALGILLAGRVPKKVFAVGELSLSGQVKACGWSGLILPVLRDVRTVVAHPVDIAEIQNQMSANDVAKLRWISAENLNQAIEAFSAAPAVDLSDADLSVDPPAVQVTSPDYALLKQVTGEPLAVLAALCALKERFHLLLAGSHGVGKSMLARALTLALPPLSETELQSRKTLSAMFGELPFKNNGRARPVISLQSGATKQSLEGSLLDSGRVLPGELTRAHCGVLIVDEFLELRRDVIESLRQPIEEKCVRMSRAKLKTVLPADFQLIATTNLCPCGYLGHARRRCRCGGPSAVRYLTKLSGPMLDRFDAIILMGDPRVESELSGPARDLLGWLTNPVHWPGLFERGPDARSLRNEPAFLWQDLGEADPGWSPRVREKQLRLARVIATLAGEHRGLPPTVYFELANALRADLDWEVRRDGAIARV